MILRLLPVLALVLLYAVPLRAQPAQPEAAAEIAALTSELAAAGETLELLQARYDELPWSRDNTDDFAALARQVDTLRTRMTDIGRRIAALRDAVATAASVVSVSPLRASLNDYGGPPVPASVSDGTILAYETVVQHPISDTPQIATLLWQVFDAAGNAVPALAKREQVAESGTVKPYRFRFRLADLPNGEYRVRFTYQPAAAGQAPVQVESGFTMQQAVRITRLVVAPDAVATQHSAVLYPEQAPHLFVYFTAEKAKAVTVDFALFAGSSRERRHHQIVERPLKAGETEQRVGIRLDPGKLRDGEEAVFAATVTGPDGTAISREVSFHLRAHEARISLADRLQANEAAVFSIAVPPLFVPPLQVRLDPDGATASLSGTTGGRVVPVLAAGATTDGRGRLAVTVTDAEGRVARGVRYFTIVAPPPPPVIAQVPAAPAPSGDWARALDTSKPAVAPAPAQPAAPAGPSLQDQLQNFQRQIAQIQADRQNAQRQSDLKRQQKMQQQTNPGQARVATTAKDCRQVKTVNVARVNYLKTTGFAKRSDWGGSCCRKFYVEPCRGFTSEAQPVNVCGRQLWGNSKRHNEDLAELRGMSSGRNGASIIIMPAGSRDIRAAPILGSCTVF